MELPSSRFSSQPPLSELRCEKSVEAANMAMTIPMYATRPLVPESNGFDERTTMGLQSRPRVQCERIELPPIREVIPGLPSLLNHQVQNSRTEEQSCASEYRSRSPSSFVTGTISPQSPQSKRRRLSADDETPIEPRDTRQPPSPGRQNQSERPSPLSGSSIGPRTTMYSPEQMWPTSRRESQYLPPPSSLQGIRSPPPSLLGIRSPCFSEARADRVTLPSLNLNIFSHENNLPDRTQQCPPLCPDYTFGAPMTMPSRPGHTILSRPYETTMPYAQSTYAYGYQQPRGQSFSGTSLHDRTPFSSGYSQPLFHDGYHHDIGHDSKQRKRRGNLPKDTTDKLRSWFLAHLHHPYPTEDEKQDLMRQTGLQMNQISNWFINARRRQLPAMINNAQAEKDARSAQGTDRPSYTQSDRNSLPDSDDGEGSPYEEYNTRCGNRKRESV